MNVRKVWDEVISYYTENGIFKKSIMYFGYFVEKSPEFRCSFTQFGGYTIYNAITEENVAIDNDGSI